MGNSAKSQLNIAGNTYDYFALQHVADSKTLAKLPFAVKVLLENLLRRVDGQVVTNDDVKALAAWNGKKINREIAFMPARVLLQDFTGVPAVVDLAAMRDAMKSLGGTPSTINPLVPVELVIDHSIMVDHYGNELALQKNTEIEFERNKERYKFLRWGQEAFDNFRVVPPNTGIVHQVNLEYLARVTFAHNSGGSTLLYPDTLVGTDSHTTMINGLGVLGWGVGGIEAEAAMLGQPVTMLVPEVIGFKLTGRLPEGATATDLVLTVTEMLRSKGVVEKIVEFYGDGLADLPLADRATIANMAPEYGATAGIFPIDEETLNYLRATGRSEDEIAITEAYAKAQGMFRMPGDAPVYTDTLELDMSTVEPSIAGPKRPQDRILLKNAKSAFHTTLPENTDAEKCIKDSGQKVNYKDQNFELKHGDVVIAAITSCTNTSNPYVMVAAGLIAQKALELGLNSKPWVKTSLAPGSQVVTEYLTEAGLLKPLADIGFNLVGYGCTTCIGNSGPLSEPIEKAIKDGKLISSAVLSGNRNFEGRVHPNVRNAYLASPPLVILYALAGSMNIDLFNDAIGQDKNGNDVFMKDLWPSNSSVAKVVQACMSAKMFKSRYADVFKGDANWQALPKGGSETYNWDDASTYVKNPPYFEGMTDKAEKLEPINSARCLVKLGDSVTTDHISPAGSINIDSPAANYLDERGVERRMFNSYGSRRGNHEIMMRGTFANVRLRNQLAPGTEGGITRHLPDGEQMSIFDAAMKYKQEGTPLVVLAGKEYGTGSSRDWAAKGTRLLGVRIVIAESYERIHRSNLIGMGVIPAQFEDGQNADSLGLTGEEVFDIDINGLAPGATLTVKATGDKTTTFKVKVRIDTPKELGYLEQGGILHYVLRQLAA